MHGNVSAEASAYACHYCGRTDGARTKDHKLPKILGGTKRADNIVLSCLMCNMIKSGREYGMFVLLFAEFLSEYGEEYRATDPDNFRTIGGLHRRFNRWLRATQHRYLTIGSAELQVAWPVAVPQGTKRGNRRGCRCERE